MGIIEKMQMIGIFMIIFGIFNAVFLCTVMPFLNEKENRKIRRILNSGVAQVLGIFILIIMISRAI